MNKFVHFLKNEIVLVVSLILALISIIFVPVDAAYISYIDFRTLAILFCLMVIMAGLQRLRIFDMVGESLISKVSSVRILAVLLVILCFFFSMFITNDVALLTFVPFTIVVLNMIERNELLIHLVVLETVAANLGSMMMPMGNPQNLYLYSLTDLSLPAFVLLMLPYGALSLVLILGLCVILLKNEKVALQAQNQYGFTKKEKVRLTAYLLLFAVSLLVVARVLDYRIAFVLLLLALLVLDRRIFGCVDYSLLFTFTFLFIFIGNLKRIPAISEALSQIVAGHEIGTGILASQVISNVPAAILLSGFTDNIRGLIIGTNLGGLGTLIASMASLISFKLYGVTKKPNVGKFMLEFTVINLGLLAVLAAAAMLLQ